jgi:hypothetical protein
MLPKNLIHHAVLVLGNMESIKDELVASIEDVFDVSHKSNPDFHFEEIVSWGIDDSRKIKEMQSVAPMASPLKVFLVSFGSMTHEAQNALLKIVEEPTPSTRFVFVTRSSERLLPTFLSRFYIIEVGSQKQNTKNESKNFLGMSLAGRIAFVKKIADDKDRGKARWFLEGLASELRASHSKNKDALIDIENALSYIGDQSSSVKLVLEGLSLTLPRT